MSNISKVIMAIEYAIGAARGTASCALDARYYAEAVVSRLENILDDLREMVDLDENNERMRTALNLIKNALDEIGDY